MCKFIFSVNATTKARTLRLTENLKTQEDTTPNYKFLLLHTLISKLYTKIVAPRSAELTRLA